MKPQDPAGQDAGDLVEALGRVHVHRFRRIFWQCGIDLGIWAVKAQRHRALPSEMLTRPMEVVVMVDRSPGC